MYRKSKAVGDITPLNRGLLLRDIEILQKKIDSIGLDVQEMGDAHAELISSKTKIIFDKVHDAGYYLVGMRESLFDSHNLYAQIPPPERHEAAPVRTVVPDPDTVGKRYHDVVDKDTTNYSAPKKVKTNNDGKVDETLGNEDKTSDDTLRDEDKTAPGQDKTSPPKEVISK